MSQKTNTRDGRRNGTTASAEKETSRGVTRLEDGFYQLHDELLAGIPNDVTLKLIASTLPRRSCEVLTEVSRDWQQAIQTHMVYDARVREETTKEYFLVECGIFTGFYVYDGDNRRDPGYFGKYILSLYSRSDQCWYRLPTIPGCIPGCKNLAGMSCQSVFLNGSIYNLGGWTKSEKGYIPVAEVHSLDLAGHQSEWRRCPNMQVPRACFKAAVMGGKIFVFGGSKGMGFPGGEVYDPQVDAWSWIKPIIPLSYIYDVFTVGEQLLVCGKQVSEDEAARLLQDDVADEKDDQVSEGEAASLPEDYVVDDNDLSLEKNPVEKKFRVTFRYTGFPELIETNDDDAEDDHDLDCFHELIENHEYFQEDPDFWNNDLDEDPLGDEVTASYVSSKIRYHKQLNHFVGAYDPVKDEWKGVERESLDIASLDIALWPKRCLGLYLGDSAYFTMWTMSL